MTTITMRVMMLHLPHRRDPLRVRRRRRRRRRHRHRRPQMLSPTLQYGRGMYKRSHPSPSTFAHISFNELTDNASEEFFQDFLQLSEQQLGFVNFGLLALGFVVL